MKRKITKKIAHSIGKSIEDTKAIVGQIFQVYKELMLEDLANGKEEYHIRGFGKFKLKLLNRWVGYNTYGTFLDIPPRNKLIFKPTREFRLKVKIFSQKR